MSALTLTPLQKNQIASFRRYCAYPAAAFCAQCLIKLYPDEVKFKELRDSDCCCTSWNRSPLRSWPEEWIQVDKDLHGSVTGIWISNDEFAVDTFFGVVVCSACCNKPSRVCLKYPGDIPTQVEVLNYREKSLLSPVKLMTQITRKAIVIGKNRYRMGHYELNGYLQMRHNYENAHMLYGGMLGLPFNRDDGLVNVDMERVQEAYQELAKTNGLLRHYLDPTRAEKVVDFHVKEYSRYIRKEEGWKDNMLMPNEDNTPMAASIDFNNLVIGHIDGKHVQLGYPGLMALLFPHLFPLAKGHYSLTTMKEVRGPDGIIPEENGGVASATSAFTFSNYCKHQLMNVDRRFATDIPFLFWCYDTKEKERIHSAARFTARKGSTRKKDVITKNGNFNMDTVTSLPRTLKGSVEYKRSQYLDIKTICDRLGPPSLFMTMTCHDTSTIMKKATVTNEPWKDPVLFALHYRRMYQEFFNNYVLKKWDVVVTDWSYVVEFQDRGSPHVHTVLWTERDADSLLKDESVVCARLPLADSDLYPLVSKFQMHKCNVRYCKDGDPQAECRFHYPKPIVDEAHFENDHAQYQRGASDVLVNPYNPYFLSLFQCNMDIQVNKGFGAMHYLSKYITKYDSKVEVKLVTKEKTVQEYFNSRLVGSVEATYNLLSFNHHRSSRMVIYVAIELPQDQQGAIRSDIQDPLIGEDELDIFKHTIIEKYEKREGGSLLTLPEFVCHYYPATDARAKVEYLKRLQSLVRVDDLPYPVPEGIVSGDTVYRLRQGKKCFWRTRAVNCMQDSELFYYQQVVTNVAIFQCTYEEYKCKTLLDTNTSWKQLYEYLVSQGLVVGSTEHTVAEPQPDEKTGLKMSYNQQAIFDQIVQRISLNDNMQWILGSAGTGKSFLLAQFAQHYADNGYQVIRLAPTGVAAHNIHGETIDRFFGTSNNIHHVNRRKLTNHVKLYKKTIFLIDEFSMVSKEAIDNVSSALISVTGRHRPFGGIAVILFGDVGQLLPVFRLDGSRRPPANIWHSSLFRHGTKYVLKEPFRQQGDLEFQQVLKCVRAAVFVDKYKTIDSTIVKFIMKRALPVPANCVRLYTTRALAKKANEDAITNLAGKLVLIDAVDYPPNSKTAISSLNYESRLLDTLLLKINATVMLTHNIDVPHGWCNGALATVIEIADDMILLQHMRNNSKKKVFKIRDYIPGTAYSRLQFPVALAYASTIHKVQSLTLEKVAIFFSDMPSHGELYVAMSRVRSLEDLYFFGIDRDALQRRFRMYVNCDALQIIDDLEES